MKKKVVYLAVALAIALAASWSTRASALPRYCNTGCTPTTSPSYPCTCPGTSIVTTCGVWQNVCFPD